LEKRLLFISIGLTTAIILYLIYRDFIAQPRIVEKKEVILSYGVPALTLPDELYFAGERVPLEDPDVRERLDRELHVNTFWHSNTIFLLKRGHRWLPEIEMVLKEYNIPDDMKYLAVIESDLQNKVSPKQAVGFWQLLKSTAKELGLEVTSEVDERYHPIKATEAACKYMNKAYGKFGSWTNTAAAYNAGVRGIQRVLDKQKVNSYYDLLLGEETSRYVFRSIAIKLIFEDPQTYGFQFEEDHLYRQEKLKKIKVTESIANLREFAFENGISYKILKRHNPWLRKNSLNVRQGKEYIIQIPKKSSFSTVVSRGEESSKQDSLNLTIENP
jgi:hypothetical protein